MLPDEPQGHGYGVEIHMTKNTNRKTGLAKFETLVKATETGRKIGLNRIRKYTGLSTKSIAMYASWNHFGAIRKGKLIVRWA